MSKEEIFTDQPHRRFNILNQSWVLCSPHRSKRPWLGQTENPSSEKLKSFDETCYLCPGNKRANGEKNPDYKSTYSFTNDFSALLPDLQEKIEKFNEEDLIIAKPERGTCKVIIFSPYHSKTLPVMDQSEILDVIECWCQEFKEISKIDWIQNIQIFENKGAVMGCSNPHPHCQIWATENIPQELSLELKSTKDYFDKKKECMLCNYLKLELSKNERIITKNDSFVALVPYWAVWPFETMVLPLQHSSQIIEMNNNQKKDFANIIKEITTKYDNIFNCSFPYSMGIHQSPVKDLKSEFFHFHVHFYPPLLRSSTVKKFYVGYEMLGEPQRDITPEKASKIIKETSTNHYTKK